MTRWQTDDHEPTPPPEDTETLPLFATPIREMARSDDPKTSKEAAIAVADHLSELQQRVYQAFQELGPMTAKQAERLDRFNDLGFSTVRKRISELQSRQWLKPSGKVEGGCTVYEVGK